MEFFEAALGLGREAQDLTIAQMAARALVVYLATLAIIRIGKKRFMAQASAFDVIVGIVLGSVVSRAITGNAPLAPAMAAAAVIMLLHWLFSAAAVRSHRFGMIIKGSDRLIVRDGKVDEEALCSAHLTTRDLDEALRTQGLADLAQVAEARVERDGTVSVVKKRPTPQIVEVTVAEGVQRIRVELA